MLKIISFLLLPFLLISQELEVVLPTRSNVKPLYFSLITNEKSPEADEIYQTFVFDLNASGFCKVLEKEQRLESATQNLFRGSGFDLSVWKNEKIPFCLSCQLANGKLELIVYNIEQGTSKKYRALPANSRAIHHLADTVLKDLFGVEGISSLKLIYTVRKKSTLNKGLPWLSEVWISDYDGKNAKQLTRENSYCLSPVFLNHEEFFYVSEKSGQSKIYRRSLSGDQSELMVDLRGNQALANINFKNNHLAFISDVAGRPDLFLQKLDLTFRTTGKAKQIFTAPRATQASPTFSPDGRKIAFVSDKDGPPRIYTLDLVSRKPKPRLLTRKNRENTSPSWSPDGTKLAYSAKVDGVRQIWIYDFVTDEEVQLTTGFLNKENPAWAPDSLHLIFNTESEEDCSLFLTNLLNKESIRIGKGRFASWQPRYYTARD